MDRERINIILADCEQEEVRSFAEELRYQDQPFVVASHIANWKRTGAMSQLKRYVAYFQVAWRYFLRREEYNAVVGWQQFYALIFSFYCRLFRVKKKNVTIALNFTYKEKSGIVGKLYKWFVARCLSPVYMDYIHVLSQSYADVIAKEFDYPRDRILVGYFGIDDHYGRLCALESPEGFRKNGYALAIGRSNRDYDFLIRAWRGVDFPLVIISDTYKKSVDEENVTILNDVAGKESEPWIANCGLMIIPIDDGKICSGDTVLLTAMSLERKIIVTEGSTLAEMYITDGENALLAPKDEEKFREVVRQALGSGRYENLGEQARQKYLEKFSRKQMARALTAGLL